jgi:hypothetical protein
MSAPLTTRDFFELVKAIGESKSKQEEDRIIADEVGFSFFNLVACLCFYNMYPNDGINVGCIFKENLSIAQWKQEKNERAYCSYDIC